MAREIKYIAPDQLVIMGLDLVEEDNPLNDERAVGKVDEAMVRNVMIYGIQLPVLVRYEAGRAYVVDGRQRVKAAREATKRQDAAGEHLTKVPCIEVKADDARVGGIMISTNEIRRNDKVLMKARKAARLLDMVGNKEEVALAFGRSTKTIDNWMKLLQADPVIHEAIEGGKISAAVGIQLSNKTREEQVQALDQILSAGPGTENGPSGDKTAPKKASDGEAAQGHQGVKKGWLRKALKTDTFHRLEPEHQEVLSWILSGYAPQGHWVEQFAWNADEELGNKQ